MRIVLTERERSRNAVGVLLRNRSDDSTVESTSDLLSDMSSLHLSIKRVLEMLEDVSGYIDKVVVGHHAHQSMINNFRIYRSGYPP